MKIRDKIWYDLVNLKNEEQYLIRYISYQYEVKRWFRIITLLFSGGGIFSAFQEFKTPTIISLICIGVIQIFQLIESELIVNDETFDHFKNIKSRTSKLFIESDKLFHDVTNKRISEESALKKLNSIRNIKIKIDDDSIKKKLHIKKKLFAKAREETLHYLNTYYGKN